MVSKLAIFSLVSSASAGQLAGGFGSGDIQILHKDYSVIGGNKCAELKDEYKKSSCCGNPMGKASKKLIPDTPNMMKMMENPCEYTKPPKDSGWDNFACMKDELTVALDQSGTNITAGYYGTNNLSDAPPILTSYFHKGLCPINVHWHLGTEHYSLGEFDEGGMGPSAHIETKDRRLNGVESRHSYKTDSSSGRRLGDISRLGFRCHYYDEDDARFTTEYDWKYCTDMHVGETYEVHWPHSLVGDCGTPNQYQSPFYDGVFCNFAAVVTSAEVLESVGGTAGAIGVQGQIFTLINDESYYYPELIRGMIVDGDFGKDVVTYTGSTTGTSRDNVICSAYSPITWKVDRKCHLISASSFDKMCADMMDMKDDMSDDLYPHGARELVADHLAADEFYHPEGPEPRRV